MPSWGRMMPDSAAACPALPRTQSCQTWASTACVGTESGAYAGGVRNRAAQGLNSSGAARSEGADEALLRALYEQHGGAVLAYATRLTGDPIAAQDVLQETLIRAWRHPEALAADRGPIRPWLFTVAARIVVDRARRAKARPREVREPLTEPSAHNDPADKLIESIPLYEAVRSLSEPHRAVVIEVYFRGRTIAETAQTLGAPEGTIKSRLFAALRSLRNELGTPRGEAEPDSQHIDREVTA